MNIRTILTYPLSEAIINGVHPLQSRIFIFIQSSIKSLIFIIFHCLEASNKRYSLRLRNLLPDSR